jgi:hypothetical protein
MLVIAIGLILLSDAIQALQSLIEEELLQDADAVEADVVAFEGMWGFFLSTFVVMPLSNILPSNSGEGIYENTLESFIMLIRSPKIMVVCAIYLCAVAAFNQTGMLVTAFSGAVYRTIVENLRAISVWVLSVAVFYIWPASGAGEGLGYICAVEGGGFLTMLLGSLIYNQVLEIPGFKYGNGNELQSVEVAVPVMDMKNF